MNDDIMITIAVIILFLPFPISFIIGYRQLKKQGKKMFQCIECDCRSKCEYYNKTIYPLIERKKHSSPEFYCMWTKYYNEDDDNKEE